MASLSLNIGILITGFFGWIDPIICPISGNHDRNKIKIDMDQTFIKTTLNFCGLNLLYHIIPLRRRFGSSVSSSSSDLEAPDDPDDPEAPDDPDEAGVADDPDEPVDWVEPAELGASWGELDDPEGPYNPGAGDDPDEPHESDSAAGWGYLSDRVGLTSLVELDNPADFADPANPDDP